MDIIQKFFEYVDNLDDGSVYEIGSPAYSITKIAHRNVSAKIDFNILSESGSDIQNYVILDICEVGLLSSSLYVKEGHNVPISESQCMAFIKLFNTSFEALNYNNEKPKKILNFDENENMIEVQYLISIITYFIKEVMDEENIITEDGIKKYILEKIDKYDFNTIFRRYIFNKQDIQDFNYENRSTRLLFVYSIRYCSVMLKITKQFSDTKDFITYMLTDEVNGILKDVFKEV